MTDIPWLTIAIALPLAGCLVLLALPVGRDRLAKQIALVFSLVTLAVTLVVAVGFDPSKGYQFTETHSWIGTFGINYAVGVDGIGLVLVVLTAFLTPVVMGASWNDVPSTPPVGDDGRPARGHSVRAFFAWILLLEAITIGVFAAVDVFLFYVFFEASLVPMYFLIAFWGGPRRGYAAMKFLLYSLFGGMLMLAAVVGLYVVSARAGTPSFLLADMQRLHIDPTTQKWLFLGFFIAFAIKAPLWPFHTWLPDAAGEATPGASVLLVSVMDKIGTFGMIRYCLTLFPDASKWATPVILVLAVIGVLYGALLAIGQREFQRLIAYTSVSHFGIMVLGIFAMTSVSQTGSTILMVNHGLSTAALFLVAGYLIHRKGHRRMDAYGGVDKVAPILSGTFLFACLSGLALPGLSTFISEFLSLAGTFQRYRAASIMATLAIVLASLYMLIMYQKSMTGPTRAVNSDIKDMSVREIVAIAPVVILIAVLGFFPKPLINVVKPSVEQTMSQVGVTDPAPSLPATATGEGTK